jgi:hypothetical protein
MSRGSKGGRKRGGTRQSNTNNASGKDGRQDTAKSSNTKSGNAKSTGRKRGRSKKVKQDPIVFWGNPESLPTHSVEVSPAENVHAIVESLGRAPIPGQEANAAHYFALVYDRAAGLAHALAAAGGLDRPVDGAEVDDED